MMSGARRPQRKAARRTKTTAQMALQRAQARARREKYEIEFAHQVMATGLPEPEKQFFFHPTRKWRFDFAWPGLMLAVEIDGGVYSGGRHTRGAGYEEDCRKKYNAMLLGWRVLNFTTGMVTKGEAISVTERMIYCLAEETPPPGD